jgi:hypothetical protein
MNPGIGMQLAYTRVDALLDESNRRRARRATRREPRASSPSPSSLCRESVALTARDLVRIASGNGYRRDELVQLIEALW